MVWGRKGRYRPTLLLIALTCVRLAFAVTASRVRDKDAAVLGRSSDSLQSHSARSSRKKGFVSGLAGAAMATATASMAGSGGSQGNCCQVCPENFYEEVSLLDISLERKREAVRRFHKAHFPSSFIEDGETTISEGQGEKRNGEGAALLKEIRSETRTQVHSIASKKGGSGNPASKGISALSGGASKKKTGATSEKVGSSKKKTGATSEKDGSSKKKTGATSAKAGSSSAKGGSGAKAGSGGAKAGSGDAKSGSKAGSGAAKSGSKAGSDAAKSGSKAGSDAAKSGAGASSSKSGAKSGAASGVKGGSKGGSENMQVASPPPPAPPPPPLPQQLTAKSVGAMGAIARDHSCCPICTSTYLPPSDYFRQVAEPPGSTYAWGVSFLEEKTKDHVGISKTKTKDHVGISKRYGGSSSASKSGAGGAGIMGMSSGFKSPIDAGRGAQTCCNVCFSQLYAPRDWSDVNTFLEIRHHKIKSKETGFVSSLTGGAMNSLAGAVSNSMVNGRTTPPTCACRLCKEKLGSKPIGNRDPEIGLADGTSEMGAGQMRPRNPMNRRPYPGQPVKNGGLGGALGSSMAMLKRL